MPSPNSICWRSATTHQSSGAGTYHGSPVRKCSVRRNRYRCRIQISKRHACK
ncbi:unnamed protein product [Gongylonema pulchrum]|uniref:Uncharacterized protein n=1 Tax=Gongylonema pulchrum TaxID=637853 RepID=A0A3P6UCN4_9BILA|nr:unnamed protein product [Gongylonema pulchrum]